MALVVEAKSLQLALVKAASQLGVIQAEVGYEITEHKRGFFGFFGARVTIEAWKKRSARGSVPRKEPSREKRSRPVQVQRERLPLATAEELQVLGEELRVACQKLCSFFEPGPVPVSKTIVADHICLDIQSEWLKAQFFQNNKLIDAFEHILHKMPKNRSCSFRLFVDVLGIRKAREGELLGVAKDTSEKVHESKQPIILNYRSAYDRKVIHMALDQDPRVYTQSVGHGPTRKLMVAPNKNYTHDDVITS
jgi:spoIIIJ-associated protein